MLAGGSGMTGPGTLLHTAARYVAARSAVDVVLVAQVRPFDGLIHEVGPRALPACGAGAPRWHAITRAQATALCLMPCSCCPRGL
jgi:hypothetical protein